MVVWAAREGQWIEAKRIDHRQFQELQVRIKGSEMGDVEVDNVVAEEELGILSQSIKLLQTAALGAPRHGFRVVGVGNVSSGSQ